MKYVNCNGMMRKSAYLSHDTSINIDHIASFKYTFWDSPPGGGGREDLTMSRKTFIRV